MDKFPPNINPELFSIIACIVGFILEDDFNANELNSIGNWIILVGQFMLTTAAQQELINARYRNMRGSNIRSDVNNHANKNPEKMNRSDLDNILRTLEIMQRELNNLKNKKEL